MVFNIDEEKVNKKRSDVFVTTVLVVYFLQDVIKPLGPLYNLKYK